MINIRQCQTDGSPLCAASSVHVNVFQHSVYKNMRKKTSFFMYHTDTEHLDSYLLCSGASQLPFWLPENNTRENNNYEHTLNIFLLFK